VEFIAGQRIQPAYTLLHKWRKCHCHGYCSYYFAYRLLAGGMIPFMRRYSTICP
jgi:hypothetical protein